MKECTVDNIVEEVQKQSVVSKEVVEAAANKIAQKRNEALTQELVSLLVQAEYAKNRTLLDLREVREIEKVKLKAVKEVGDLLEKVKNGDLNMKEFNRTKNEIDNKISKEINEIKRKFSDFSNDLFRSTYQNVDYK